MSKFFNETLKSRLETPSDEGLLRASLTEALAVEPELYPDSGAPGINEPKIAESRKIEIPVSNLLPVQFAGSTSLKSAEESYRALRTRLLKLSSAKDIRSIVITSSVPSEGKTLTSLNLAVCCSQLQDMRVLLVDGDIRTSGLTRAMGCHARPGLAEVLSREMSAEAAVLETNHPNLYVCGSGIAALPPPELYAASSWQEFMAWCKRSFNLVLLDSPPVMDLADVELMTAACDGVLLLVRARRTRREDLQKCAGQIDAKKLLGVVYNGMEGARHNYDFGGYYYYEGVQGRSDRDKVANEIARSNLISGNKEMNNHVSES